MIEGVEHEATIAFRPAPALGYTSAVQGAGSRASTACAALALIVGCADDAPRSTRPNLLLVTIDTLRADRLACYGGEPDLGVAICALADAGTRFEWAFAAAPYTAPSVASILTSSHPAQHGVTQSALSFLEDEAVSVAELLRDAGYTTAAFVSNPVLDRSRNLNQGFDVWDQRMERRERNRSGFRDRDARSATDAALAWARVGAATPWFLWMHYQDPHGPYDPPGSYPPFDAPDGPRLQVLEEHSGLGGIPAYQALPGRFSVDAYAGAYAHEVRFVDIEVRRLIEGLDALGAPPAVLLTADHGEAFGEDGYWFAHGHSVGLDQIRVPLLWRPARPQTPSLASTPVGGIDVAPTLLAAAGIEIPSAFEGSPLPVVGLSGSVSAAERPVFAEHELRAAVIVGRRYYARDTRPVHPDERDRVSGGRVVPLPRRSARLPESGALPAYDEPGPEAAADALEGLLAEYVEAAAKRTAPRRGEVSAELREQLDALGYLD